ncbi:MAG: helix-turn-helix domain-containing protein [Solirubrobacteraceae bacterium]
MRAEDVAPMLQVEPATVREWARAGTIPHVRIGRSVRFDESALERWITAQIAERWPACAASSDA